MDSDYRTSKGFMHAVEGIIAAMLIITYTASIIQYPFVNDNWANVKKGQAAREFLSAFNDAGLSYIIVDGRSNEFMSITKSFLGAGRSYGLSTEGLLPRNVIVGVMSNYSERINMIPVSCSTYGIPNDVIGCGDVCYNASFNGHWFMLTDNDTGISNSQCDYDSIYFDSDSNGAFGPYEGPKFVSGTINVSNDIWVFSSIGMAPVTVEFADGTNYVDVRNSIDDVVMNGRRTNITFRAVTNKSDFAGVDVILVPQYIRMSDIKERIIRYLDSGGAIVEIANIGPGDLDDVQTDIFGLEFVSYPVSVAGNDDIQISDSNVTGPFYEIRKYFSSTDINVMTDRFVYSLDDTWSAVNEYDCDITEPSYYLGHVVCTGAGPDPCVTYVLSGILGHVDSSSNPPIWCKIGDANGAMRYLYGYFNVRTVDYFAMIVNSSGTGYDEVYIDIDGDMDLTNDGGPFFVGDTFYLDSERFVISSIYDGFRGFSIRAFEDHQFAGQSPLNLYSVKNDTSYVLLEQNREFYTTDLSYGDALDFYGFSPGGCTTNIIASEYRYNDTWVLPYSVTIVNISRGFNMFLVDFNGDGDCNDYDEGPYYEGDVLSAGPEYYRVHIEEDGSFANWTLMERWKVPFSVVNHKSGLRRAVWISGGVSSVDAWQFVRSVIIWATDKRNDFLKSSDSSGSVIVKGTFVANDDFFQPYKVYFRSGG